MEIGVVVHGPGIIDSGYALKIINLLSNYGNVHCRLGGTMGRTAVIDAALEDMIDISLKLLPSESLELFNRANYDVIFLLNYGKSSLTGQVFGYKTFMHYFKKISNEDYLATNHKPLYNSKIPVIQIERPGEEDGSIISWNVVLNKQLEEENKNNGRRFFKKDMVEALTFDFEDLFYGVANELNLNKVDPEEVVSMYFSENIEYNDDSYVNKIIRSLDYYDESKNYTYRKVHGASSGENIFLNGTVVGYAHSNDIILIAEDGVLVEIDGGEIKPHGVEKLGVVNLNNVIVKTGLLRKSDEVTPRILDKDSIYIGDSERNSLSEEHLGDGNSFKVGFVDHAAYDIYRFKNFDLVVAIGDDTSLVASDILYRFDIPIIGITDGDLDKVVEKGFVNEKSTIVEVASGFDDVVGHNVFVEVFESNQILEVPFSEDYEDLAKFKQIMLDVIKSHVLDSVKKVVPTFIERDYNFNEVYSFSHDGALDDAGELHEEFHDGFVDEGLSQDKRIETNEVNEEVMRDFENEYVDSISSESDIVEDNPLDEENSDDMSFAELVEEISTSYGEYEDSNVDNNLEDDLLVDSLVSADDDMVFESVNDSIDFPGVEYVDLAEEVSAEFNDKQDLIYGGSAEFNDKQDLIYGGSAEFNDKQDLIYGGSAEFNDKQDLIYGGSAEFNDKQDLIYGGSADEEFIEENVVYVDEDGNEIVFEEGVIYVDSEGNKITFDNENGISSVSDDDFIVLDDEDSTVDSQVLEKYNDILGEYVNGYEESLDEEFFNVSDESKDDEKLSDDANK